MTRATSAASSKKIRPDIAEQQAVEAKCELQRGTFEEMVEVLPLTARHLGARCPVSWVQCKNKHFSGNC